MKALDLKIQHLLVFPFKLFKFVVAELGSFSPLSLNVRIRSGEFSSTVNVGFYLRHVFHRKEYLVSLSHCNWLSLMICPVKSCIY